MVWKRIIAVLALTVTLSLNLWGLPVKVVAVDYRAREITVLLPLHNTTMEAVLIPEEPEVRVRLNEFYEAAIEPGKVNTVKRNFLRIKIPHQKPVKFRVFKISFLEHQ